MGTDEDVLQGVLGVGARTAEHLGGIRQQPYAVAVVDRAEGFVGASSEERDELVVGVKPEHRARHRQPWSRNGCGAWEGGGFHWLARDSHSNARSRPKFRGTARGANLP